jgi:putative tryptophan/tyrosine transport system substrate-binding protein
MRRRDFILALGGAAASPTWPQAARAQQKLPVVAFLSVRSPDGSQSLVTAFRAGLTEAGYTEGRNVAVEYHWTDGRSGPLPALAADLASRQVAAIVTSDTVSTLAAKAATTAVPIVFNTGVDPVALGLVTSLSRPGGNITGITNLTAEMGGKRLQLLHELVPQAVMIGSLWNPSSPTIEQDTRGLQAAAHALGLELRIEKGSTDQELDAAFASLAQARTGGLFIWADAYFTAHSQQLAALSVRYRLPAIYQFREFAAAGGLMSYGGSITDAHRLLGVYAGRILKGEKPADLPVQQSTKVELFINLKTAKALGVAVPSSLLATADEVIE